MASTRPPMPPPATSRRSGRTAFSSLAAAPSAVTWESATAEGRTDARLRRAGKARDDAVAVQGATVPERVA